MPPQEKESSTRIVCWNVNSIKACIRRVDCQDLEELLSFLGSPDIACFQETKLTKNELDESLACPASYHAFYSFSRRKKHKAGYSGTVTLVRKKSKIPIVDAEEGLSGVWSHANKQSNGDTRNSVANATLPAPSIGGNTGPFDDFIVDSEVLKDVDSEGRCVITDHEKFVLFNLYCPAITIDPLESPEKYELRIQFKRTFLSMLKRRSKSLLNGGRHVIICGDLNCSTTNPLDSAWSEEDKSPPKMLKRDDESQTSLDASSSLPKPLSSYSESTRWLLSMFKDLEFTDTFRHLNPSLKKYSCWSMKTSARKNNYGCRIDYFLTSPTENFTEKYVLASNVLDKVEGSDHAPIELLLSVPFESSGKPTVHLLPLCASNNNKFAGQKRMEQYMINGKIDGAPKIPSSNSTRSQPRPTKPKQKSLFDLGLTKGSITSIGRKRRRFDGPRVPDTLSRIVKKPCWDATPFDTCGKVGVASGSLMAGKEVTKAQRKTSMPSPDVKRQWKTMLHGKGKTIHAPLCKCGIKAVLRVSNTIKSKGKRFYVCANPPGEKGKEGSRCNFFSWATVMGKVIEKKGWQR